MTKIRIVEGEILHADLAEWRGSEVGHRCNVCDFWFKRKELYDHPDLGFICYPDKVRMERLEAADKRFEWEMDQAGRESR